MTIFKTGELEEFWPNTTHNAVTLNGPYRTIGPTDNKLGLDLGVR